MRRLINIVTWICLALAIVSAAVWFLPSYSWNQTTLSSGGRTFWSLSHGSLEYWEFPPPNYCRTGLQPKLGFNIWIATALISLLPFARAVIWAALRTGYRQPAPAFPVLPPH